jgi:hypothetical protein
VSMVKLEQSADDLDKRLRHLERRLVQARAGPDRRHPAALPVRPRLEEKPVSRGHLTTVALLCFAQ